MKYFINFFSYLYLNLKNFMKKVSAILTNSLGELDIVLPIFCRAKIKKKI